MCMYVTHFHCLYECESLLLPYKGKISIEDIRCQRADDENTNLNIDSKIYAGTIREIIIATRNF
jgi:hypothetical protein